jgi:hypothetical protein
MNKDLSKNFNRVAEQLRDAVIDFKTASKNFYEAWLELTSSEYLKHHTKLPGSNRKNRLRKKRVRRIFNWFWSKKNG